MGLFVCEKCECIENTALGHFWMVNRIEEFEWTEELSKYKNKPLCSDCAPRRFANGTLTGMGKWHDKFPKEHISKVPENERHQLYNYDPKKEYRQQ